MRGEAVRVFESFCFRRPRGATTGKLTKALSFLLLLKRNERFTQLSPAARAFLEKRYAEDMGIEDAIHTALLTLKEGFEGQVSGDNIEVAVVGTGGDRSFRVLTPSEVNDYLAEVD